MTDSPTVPFSADLLALADTHGVATRFRDWSGHEAEVPESTVVAVLAALGVDASTPRATRAALRAHAQSRWQQLLPPSVVVRAGVAAEVPVRARRGADVRVWLSLEGGGTSTLPLPGEPYEHAELDGVEYVEHRLGLPDDLPLGYHRLHAQAGEEQASCMLAATPSWLGLPASMGERRVWGFMAQLYSVRSRRSWGLGDIGDLADLAGWSGSALGAGMVLVNPLHAAQPVPPMEPSPYFPASRRFVNPVYLRVEDVPEVAYLPAADRERVDALARALQVRNTWSALIDRDAVWQAKSAALGLAFAVPRAPSRQASFDAYKRREGQGLVDFATWCALVEERGLPWRSWPAELRDPRSAEVAAERERLAGRVEFWCWLQFLADEQLAAAKRVAGDVGMSVGVVHDLAVGVNPDGADAWTNADVLAHGVTAGAPPDAFNQQGQDWRQPPWHPTRLAEAGYAPYRDMLRSVLRHAGGLRVDHALGLFRMWWVPAGSSPAEGTYVRYDHEALVGILALEAYRHGALVVGEDLGTVEPSARAYLAERGLLGTSILWFERDEQRRPRPAPGWREMCLATVTTHDLPPTAGYLDGEHVRVRAELGLLTRPVQEERAADEAHRAAWLAELRRLGLLGDEDADGARTVAALHAFLVRTPARLLGVALPDATGQRQAQNQPGTVDEYPNWRLPLTDGDGTPVLLEELVDDRRARALAEQVACVTSPDAGPGGDGPDAVHRG